MNPTAPVRDPLSFTDAPGGDGPTREHVPGFLGSSPPDADGLVDPRVRAQLWWAGGVLYRRRWFLATALALASVGAVVMALVTPVWYRAETRLLLPESGGGLGSLLENLAPGASAILGKANEGYTRYLAILSSRTMMEAVVDRFNLVEVYETQDALDPRLAAVDELFGNTSFNVSLDYDYLVLHVLDRDPQRAAQMANYFVEVLNERQNELSAGSASENRRFLERRLTEAEAALDSAQANLQAFQERYGVVELASQAEALMTSMARAQAQVAEAEVRYQTLRSQYGDANPEVETARAAVAAARGQLNRLSGGGESVMPVPLRDLPTVGRRYAEVVGELKVQEEIIRAVRPFYEQALLSERRETSSVQVLDPAIPPVRKAKPQRMLLVLTVVLSTAFLLVALLLLQAWMRRAGPGLIARLRAAAA